MIETTDDIKPKRKFHERKRPDWPIKTYQFRAYPIDIPQAAWDLADEMRHGWNHLRALWMAAWRDTGAMDKKDKAGRRERWKQYREEKQEALKSHPLDNEYQQDIQVRFKATLDRINLGKGEKPQYQEEIQSMCLFHRYTGGGKPLKTIFSTRAHRFALIPPACEYPGERTPTNRREKRKCWTRGHFGLGNGEQLEFRVLMHRAIPADHIVKRTVWNGRKNTFGEWEWHVNITTEYPPPAGEERPCGTVAVDIGWRIMGEGEAIRVAYCRDDAGREFELRLNILEEKARYRRYRRGDQVGLPSNYAGWRAYDEQIGDRVEACKIQLRALLPTNQRQGLEKMRQVGLEQLCRRLEEESGSETAQEAILDCLADIEPIRRRRNALARRLTNKRRYLYHNFASWLTKTYSEVVWEDELKIKDLKSRENKKHHPALQHAGKFAQWAAPGELRAILKQAADKNVTLLTGAPTAGSTIICSRCGDEMEATANLFIKCDRCGMQWDQDANACRNLLSFSQRVNGSGQNGGQALDIPEVLQGVIHTVQ